jgi:hypothetical protein
MAGALALSYDAAFTRTSVTRGIVASAALLSRQRKGVEASTGFDAQKDFNMHENNIHEC